MQAGEKKEGTAAAFGNDDGKSQNMDTMLEFNALSYEMEPDLSVCVERTFKEHPFQKNTYTQGETAFCVSNSGADFIDGRNSYLAFNIECVQSEKLGTTGAVEGFHVLGPEFQRLGSVLDCIRSITLTDRAGNEIERIRDVGRLSNALLRNTYSPEWFAVHGAQLGARKSESNASTDSVLRADFYPVHYDNDSHNADTPLNAVGRGFVIPLRFLAGIFDFNQLLPAQLMSGLRFEIQFQTPERSFSYPGGDPESYTFRFENVRLVLDSVKLTDSISRELNERAANDGLEIMYRTWWTSNYVGTSTSTYNVEVRKAVSRAFGALAHFEPEHNTTSAESIADVNATARYDFKEWQWRAGNQYYPHQRLRDRKSDNTTGDFADGSVTSSVSRPGPTLGGMETYNHIQRLFGKNSKSYSENDMNPAFYNHYPDYEVTQFQNPSLTLDNYSLIAENRGYVDSRPAYALIPLDLERSTVQDLSGVPLNNSRVLALDFILNSPQAGTVTIWLQHLKVARVFMDNTEIEE